MTSSLLEPTSIIIQGMTGTHGRFHTKTMLDAGMPIIGGTSPNKAGQSVHGVPVFERIADITAHTQAPIDCSIVFVPAPHAKAALFEAIEAAIPLIVCITEGIPVHDMLAVKKAANAKGITIIGPNCPGILLPGRTKLGIIPTAVGLPGSIGLVSRSGTLTYEIAAALSEKGIGQRAIIGIGGDPVHGFGFKEALELFEQDDAVDRIVMIGEIGGTEEIEAADYSKQHVTKPIYAYVAGHFAPRGTTMGHAGAIFTGKNESADGKTAYLKSCGITTADDLHELLRIILSEVGYTEL